MALAASRVMEAIRRRVLAHDGDRTLRAHVPAAVEKPVSGERFRFDRPRRGPRPPIDALTALSTAHVAVADLEKPPLDPAAWRIELV